MEASKGIEQAEVMRRWHEQQSLPKSERDIVEFRRFNALTWQVVLEPTWNFYLGEYRLLKRPRKKTVTVYLYRKKGILCSSMVPIAIHHPIGQADITYEETDDDTR